MMWVIDTHLEMGLEVIRSWGFTYKTKGFNWVKTNKDGTPFTGMGFWPNVIISALLFLVAVFGFVRLQYVLATNIVILHFHPERIQK